jgi:hypothetical protein
VHIEHVLHGEVTPIFLPITRSPEGFAAFQELQGDPIGLLQGDRWIATVRGASVWRLRKALNSSSPSAVIKWASMVRAPDGRKKACPDSKPVQAQRCRFSRARPTSRHRHRHR